MAHRTRSSHLLVSVRKMLTFVGLLFALCVVRGIGGQCLSGNDSPTSFGPSIRESLTQARFDFVLDALGKVGERERRGNIFFSPHSLHEALTLAYFTAAGRTESVLKSVLRIPNTHSKAEAQRFYGFERSMIRYQESSGNDSSSNEFRTANGLWVTNQRRVKECMLDLFSDQLQQVDFRSDPEGIRQTVNQWISEVTKGHINDLLPSGTVTAESDLILANAVYFRGLWEYPFDAKRSKLDYFYVNDVQRTLVTFMQQQGVFRLETSDEIGAKVLELPYKGDDVSMYALLPLLNDANSTKSSRDKADSVGQLIRRITMTQRGRSEFQTLLEQRSQPRTVRVTLPKFSVDKNLPVEQLLNDLGAGELLTPRANLGDLMVIGEPGLHLGSAIHRAVIEVTEEGSTASASTALFGQRMFPPSIRFNRSFFYFIYKRSSRSILFAGVYRSPPTR